jgi:hypothetical protein
VKVGAAVGFQVKGVVVVVVVFLVVVVSGVVVVVIVGLLVGLAVVTSAVGLGVTIPMLDFSLLSISLTASAIPPKFN